MYTTRKKEVLWRKLYNQSQKMFTERTFLHVHIARRLECHKWSATPISAYLRRGPRGYFRSECCIGGESVAAQRVNCFLAPIHQRPATRLYSPEAASPKTWEAKIFYFRQMRLSCLEKHLSKHKISICSKNFGGHGPFAHPRLRLYLEVPFFKSSAQPDQEYHEPSLPWGSVVRDQPTAPLRRG